MPTLDCIPPHAHPLPLVDEGAKCDPCQKEIESLRGLLDATRRDRQSLRDEVLRLREQLGARR